MVVGRVDATRLRRTSRRLATAIIDATAAMIATDTIAEGVKNLRTRHRAF